MPSPTSWRGIKNVFPMDVERTVAALNNVFQKRTDRPKLPSAPNAVIGFFFFLFFSFFFFFFVVVVFFSLWENTGHLGDMAIVSLGSDTCFG